jgi:peptidase E
MASKKRRQIFCVGSTAAVFGPPRGPPGPTPFARHILSLSDSPKPAVLFLGQARGDAPETTSEFYSLFTEDVCRPDDLALLPDPNFLQSELRAKVLAADIVYVYGGNTKNMVALWRDWEIHQLLKEAYEAGTVLAGGSAGAICWWDGCISTSQNAPMIPLRCLGLLPGSLCPHYDTPSAKDGVVWEADRGLRFDQCLRDGHIPWPAYGLDNFAALHFVDEALHEVVATADAPDGFTASPKAWEVHPQPAPRVPLTPNRWLVASPAAKDEPAAVPRLRQGQGDAPLRLPAAATPQSTGVARANSLLSPQFSGRLRLGWPELEATVAPFGRP